MCWYGFTRELTLVLGCLLVIFFVIWLADKLVLLSSGVANDALSFPPQWCCEFLSISRRLSMILPACAYFST